MRATGAPVDRAGLRPIDGVAAFPGLAGFVDGGTPAIGVVGLMGGPGAGALIRRHPRRLRAGTAGGIATLALGQGRLVGKHGQGEGRQAQHGGEGFMHGVSRMMRPAIMGWPALPAK